MWRHVSRLHNTTPNKKAIGASEKTAYVNPDANAPDTPLMMATFPTAFSDTYRGQRHESKRNTH